MLFSIENCKKRNTASLFYHLATDLGADSVKARETIVKWYNQYPKSEKKDFIGRFHSPNNEHHLGAFFELYIYSLFSENGFQVKRGGKKKPDFNVKLGSTNFHVECRMAGDSIHQKTYHKYLLGLDKIIKILNYPYSLHLDIQNYGEEFNLHQAGRFIENKLKLNKSQNDFEYLYENGEWCISIQFKYRSHLKSCIIGQLGGGFFKPIAHEFVYKALNKKKASNYSFNDEPYVIAINSLEPGLMENEINKAIFGDQGFKGFFNRKKNTSVSGVLLVNKLYPQWIESQELKWVPNPWAKYPIELPELTIGFSSSK